MSVDRVLYSLQNLKAQFDGWYWQPQRKPEFEGDLEQWFDDLEELPLNKLERYILECIPDRGLCVVPPNH